MVLADGGVVSRCSTRLHSPFIMHASMQLCVWQCGSPGLEAASRCVAAFAGPQACTAKWRTPAAARAARCLCCLCQPCALPMLIAMLPAGVHR